MNFLPIVARELLVASRRPLTYHTRLAAALLLLGVWFLIWIANPQPGGASLHARMMFDVLSVLAMLFALGAGLFLTADCLSAEKREGTLGLLFLADLRSYDVVFGKLASTSLHAVYGLLAMLPVLAIPLLMGGVSPGEFGRVALVLLVTLAMSLGTGLLVSALVRESLLAVAATLLLLLLFGGFLPLFQSALQPFVSVAGWNPVLLWPSPFYAYSQARGTGFGLTSVQREYWGSLGTVAGIALSGFVGACIAMPFTWVDRGRRNSSPRSAHSTHWQRGSSRKRARARLGLLATNPYEWLAGEERSIAFLASLAMSLLAALWVTFAIKGQEGQASRPSWVVCVIYLPFFMHVLLKFLMVLGATRRFCTDRDSGALELALVTPLPIQSIAWGHYRALGRMFRFPAAVLILIAIGLMVVVNLSTLGPTRQDREMMLTVVLGGLVLLGIDLRAIRWVGAWQALRTHKHSRAILGTFVRVMVPSWFAIFAWTLFTMRGGIGQREVWGFYLFWATMSGIYSSVISLKARESLIERFRIVASEGINSARRPSEGNSRRPQATQVAWP